MSQISPPIRVLLVAAVGFLAAWMLFLRPSPEPAPEPAASEAATPPAATTAGAAEPQSAAGQAVRQATDGAAAADAQAAGATGQAAAAPGNAAAGTTAGVPATAARGAADAPPVDRKALAALPRDVARAIERRQVLVLLFWNRKSPEDRRVRRTLRRIDRHGDRVFADAAPIRRISRFAPITRGADVAQSPTVVVVDRNLKAEALVGFVDRPTINQAVTDALRDPGPFFVDRYLRKVNHACRMVNDAFLREPDGAWSRRRAAAWFGSARRIMRRFDAAFDAIPAPKKWRRFKRASQRDNETVIATLRTWERDAGSGSRRGRRDARATFARLDRSVEDFNERMDGKRLLGCSRGR